MNNQKWKIKAVTVFDEKISSIFYALVYIKKKLDL